MAIPVISLAGIWQGSKLSQSEQSANWAMLIFATAIAAITAWICIHYFLQFVQRFSLLPFVIYRIILGVILLVIFL